MKDCPVCYAAVDGVVCGTCGHRETTAPPIPSWKQSVPRDHAATAAERAQVKEMAKRMRFASPGLDWARKILARRDAGETLPQVSIDFAREALGMGPDA